FCATWRLAPGALFRSAAAQSSDEKPSSNRTRAVAPKSNKAPPFYFERCMVRLGTSSLTRSKNIEVCITFELVIPEMFNVGHGFFSSERKSADSTDTCNWAVFIGIFGARIDFTPNDR